MKAYEAKKATYQEQYEKVMQEIKHTIKYGWKGTCIERYGKCSSFLKDPEEVINKLLDEGYDLVLYYDVNGELRAVDISWENSKEGRKGVAKIKKDEKRPVQKTSFWKRLGDFFEPDGEDGMCF